MRLEVRQLTKRFETAGERIELFNAFNLELAAGEVKVLMGPSGSGKTTLLRMLCGLEPPDGGTIDYDGKDLYAMSDETRRTFRRANIGFADQAACLLPQLTALENVLLPAIGEREDHRETARKWLSRFGLEKRQDFFPANGNGSPSHAPCFSTPLFSFLTNRPPRSIPSEATPFSPAYRRPIARRALPCCSRRTTRVRWTSSRLLFP